MSYILSLGVVYVMWQVCSNYDGNTSHYDGITTFQNTMELRHIMMKLRCFYDVFFSFILGRSFGEGHKKSIIYDSFRRYTSSKNNRRKQNHSCNKYMHHPTTEKRPHPKKRKYKDYMASGLQAEQTENPEDGVQVVRYFGFSHICTLNSLDYWFHAYPE